MKTKIVLVAIVAVIAAMLVWVKPIAQDLNYHLFADDLYQWGVSNFWNVMSNLPFVLVGGLGLGYSFLLGVFYWYCGRRYGFKLVSFESQ